MKHYFLFAFGCLLCAGLLAQPANVWINEIHYDNQGTDTLEGFEIAGAAGTSLNCYIVALYAGSTGQYYAIDTLSGTLPNQGCNIGTAWFGFPQDSVLNGYAGIALLYAPQLTGCGGTGNDTVLQFWSYGGVFTATNGPALGANSNYMGPFENSSTLVGTSLQLGGTGSAAGQFNWQSSLTTTPGAVNINQSFCLVQNISFSATTQSRQENIAQALVPVNLSNAGPLQISVDVKLVPVGTSATPGADFAFNDTTITWAAYTSGIVLVPVNIINDNTVELNESVQLKITNAVNGATIGADSIFTLTIVDDDTLDAGICADLFFSEYIEGTGNNKAIEIYNPTAAAVDLTGYSIFKSSNGGSATALFGLSGTLAPGQVYVAAHSSATGAITAQADTLSAFFDFDGNDALVLLHNTDTLDIIGQLNINPGSGWAVDSASTQNNTIIRSYYTYRGDTNWAVAVTTWNSYGADMFDSLGFHHTAPCGTIQPAPPAVLNFTVIADTALEDTTHIFIAVRLVNPSGQNAHYVVARDDQASTAVAGADYTFTNQTRNFGPGITNDTVELLLKNDNLIEPIENVILRFINLSGNVIVGPDSIYNLAIIDTDRLEVSFLGAGFSYVEDTGVVKVKVTLSTPFADTVTVHVSRAAGSATFNTDYRFNDTTIVFPPNTPDTQAVWVTIIDDAIAEPNEQINFDLTAATNGAIITISAYTLTIIDNDNQVGIVEQGAEASFTIYPNPAQNALYLRSEGVLQNISLSDIAGKEIMHYAVIAAGEGRSLDITLLQPGIYFITATSNGQLFARKIIKTGNR